MHKNVLVFFSLWNTSNFARSADCADYHPIIAAITAKPEGFKRTKLALNSCNVLILPEQKGLFITSARRQTKAADQISRDISPLSMFQGSPGLRAHRVKTRKQRKTTTAVKEKAAQGPLNLHLHLRNTKKKTKKTPAQTASNSVVFHEYFQSFCSKPGTRRVATFPVP